MASLGLTTLNEIEIHEVDASPVTSGIDAPTGSLAVLTDGTKLFLKTGALATNWSPINSLEKAEYSNIATSIQSSTSATYAPVTQLTSVSLPIGFYKIEAYVICQSTAVGTGVGIRIGQGTAVIATPMGMQWNIGQAGNGTDKFYQYEQTSAADNISATASNTANANFVVQGLGVINVTTAGTISVQLRSETGTSVSVRPNSILFIKAV
jgi:hypothetical protein